MAKKKSATNPITDTTEAATPAPRRRAPAKRVAPSVTAQADTADDRPMTVSEPDGGLMTGSPTFEQIAEAAYHRYLSRGAGDGHDFDDWIQAERELRAR